MPEQPKLNVDAIALEAAREVIQVAVPEGAGVYRVTQWQARIQIIIAEAIKKALDSV